MSFQYEEWKPPRRLRVFAFDPSTAKVHSNRSLRYVNITLPAEMDPAMGLGPSGEYLEVVDYDPASEVFYRPVNLDDPKVLSAGGLEPSEENPQFHQQMVYAVAMNTIATFEEALGRAVLWAPDVRKVDGQWNETYIPRLRIYPHALREANAFYSPTRKSLLFGYFEAGENSKSAVPGTTVFTCLSHDIVVHETVHAILDGLHPHFAESSHPDMRALHEAFADIVAIFQLFSFPEVLEEQIARTRGDLESQSMLGVLAQEFGQALGRSNALRDALGSINPKTKRWKAKPPDRLALSKAVGPHARGSILVAAVFRAFLNVYKAQAADLFRIASGGSGILRKGQLDPDLTRRLSREAATIARRILRICIRGMDYVPPVAVSFGDYLRAILTADHDLFPEDQDGYRTAILEAFTAWGIVPDNMPVVTETTLLWPTLSQTLADLKGQRALVGQTVSLDRVKGELGALITQPEVVFQQMMNSQATLQVDSGQRYIDRIRADREAIAEQVNERVSVVEKMRESDDGTPPVTGALKRADSETVSDMGALQLGRDQDRRIEFHTRNYFARLIWILVTSQTTPELGQTLGLCFDMNAPLTVRRSKISHLPSLHVLPVRHARRVGKRAALEEEYVLELVQTRHGFFDPTLQERADMDATLCANGSDFLYRAGCTVLVDAGTFAIRRLIRTPYPVDSDEGLNRLRDHLDDTSPGLANAFDDGRPGKADAAFMDLHRHVQPNEEAW